MIEFRKGEGYCRWNGTLMTDDNHKKLFGIECELGWEDDDLIICGDIVYTNLKPSEVLMKLGTIYHMEETDKILTKGYVNCELENLERNLDGQFIINPSELYVVDNIKPLNAFKKDHPNFNKKKYHEFYDELDKYFNK